MSTSSTVDTEQIAALVGYSQSGIDGTALGNTVIVRNNHVDGKNFYVTEAPIILTEAISVVAPPVISLGKTAENYNDIAPSINLQNLTAAGKMLVWQPASDTPFVFLGPGEELVLHIPTAADATAYTFTAFVRGFYA